MGRLYVLQGPSGAGKTTICRAVAAKLGLPVSVSTTTRDKRPGEVEGVHYRFVDNVVFAGMVARREFLEWAPYAGQFYGTTKAGMDLAFRAGRPVIGVWERRGAKVLRCRKDMWVTSIGILPPSSAEAALRMAKRDGEGGQYDRRLNEMAWDTRAVGDADFCIVNDVLDQAVDQVCEIIRGAGL